MSSLVERSFAPLVVLPEVDVLETLDLKKTSVPKNFFISLPASGPLASGRKTAPAETITDAQGVLRSCTCFVAGTLVRVAPASEGSRSSASPLIEKRGENGEVQYYREIQDIRVGDEVLSWNEKTGEVGYDKVTYHFVRHTDLIYTLTYEDGTTVETTWNHPFYIAGRGWIQVKDLHEGELSMTSESMNEARLASYPVLLNASVLLASVVEAEKTIIPQAKRILHITKDHRMETVYNLEVANGHSYFITEASVLVHNQSVAGYANELSQEMRMAIQNCKGNMSECEIYIAGGVGAVTLAYAIDHWDGIVKGAGGLWNDTKAGVGDAIDWLQNLAQDSEGEQETKPAENNEIDERNLSDRPNDIARQTGLSEQQVRDAIHRAKQNLPRGTGQRNPDVQVDTRTGEIYPKTPDGGIGDSIGNIYD